jgi:nucleoid-associated protein YgaU
LNILFGGLKMKIKNLSAVILSAVALLVTTGCQKKAAAPEEIADSSPVVTSAPEPAPVEEAVVEEVVETAVEEPAPVEATGKGSHTVLKGDNLWSISESSDVYDDPFQWPVIYKANRDQIKDPDLIYPDQQFELPRDSSQEEIDAAVHEAKTRGPWSLWDGK